MPGTNYLRNAERDSENFLNGDQNFARNGYVHPEVEVVISGISGAFPESENVRELAENLFSKKDLVTDGDRRCNPDFHNNFRIGKLKQLNKFDSDFFSMLPKQAEYMDPGSRIILEKVFEAIVDAGYNPKYFSGSRTGVFIARMWAPMEAMLLETKKKLNRFSIDEGCASLIANRISFWLNVRGPSFVVDSACSSSLHALDLGVKAIKSGLCDAAIVGATNICLVPLITECYRSATMISPDGICKSFDDAADGLIQSESVSVIVLQRKQDARRIYASVVHTKIHSDGYKPEGMHDPSSKILTKVLEEFYDECNVHPSEVEFVEAHAAGTRAGDIAELKALEKVFCQNRRVPLKIGSVKSNLGHAEAASGMCSIFKVLIGFESGFLPPNLHYVTPRARIDALKDGRMEVVTDLTLWDGGLTAVNNIGFGATNGHALLEPNPKIKSNKASYYEFPLLVTVSGCTEEAVDTILKDLEQKTVDVEFIGLLHEIYKDPIPKHFHRGYVILQKEIATPIRSIRKISGKERSIWFVLSGLGSQWLGMGKSLMKIPGFVEFIRTTTGMLKQEDTDVMQIITETNAANLNESTALMKAYVGIVATQIALIDFLRKVGLEPDGFLGHSVGEISCAYLDGCVTAEQAILLAYYRGLLVSQHHPINGLMASVGLSYQQVENMKPPEIDVACHNAPDNCSISGPSHIVKQFIKTLQKDNIFVREVESCNVANHSRYNEHAALMLDDVVKNIIKEPKLRSNKWISSTFLKEDWATKDAKHFSAEYFHQNVAGTVFFEEACYEIPDNAVVIEVAPHGLFQGLLKRSLPETITNIQLMSKHHPDNSTHVLQALGEVYMAGGNFCVSKLYPPVEFPVSRGTRMISPLVKWNHEQDWHVFEYDNRINVRNGTRRVTISLADEEHKYLADHAVEGQNLFPAAGYLVLVWETFALLLGKHHTEVPVLFEEVQILRMTSFSEQGSVEFIVNLFKDNGHFIILESGHIVANGNIRVLATNETEEVDSLIPIPDDDDPNQLPLSKTDVKKEWKLRGYETRGIFPAVTYLNQEHTIGKILWTDNYVSFIDSLLTIHVLLIDSRNVCVPSLVRKLAINPKAHLNVLRTLDPAYPEFAARINKEAKKIRSGGFEIQGIEPIFFAKREPAENVLMEKFECVPYVNPKLQDLSTIASVCAQIVTENFNSNSVDITELVDDFTDINETLMCQLLLEAYKNVPLIEPKVSILKNREEELKMIDDEIVVRNMPLPCVESCTVIAASHVSQRKPVIQACFDSLRNQGFLLTRETISNTDIFEKLKFSVCFACSFNNERILLLRKVKDSSKLKPVICRVSNESYSWVPELQKCLDIVPTDENQLVILLAEREQCSGIMGFANVLRREMNGKNIKCFFIADEMAPAFDIEHPIYEEQIRKNVFMNVYCHGEWCSYYLLPYVTSDTVHTSHAYSDVRVPGDLSTLRWMAGPLDPKTYVPKSEKTLIHVYFAALNFQDIREATNRVSVTATTNNRHQNGSIGYEFSGKTNDGRRFMGLKPSMATANVVECDNNHLWPANDQWTLEEAATIPFAYATALFALLECGRMKKYDSILIHSPTDGIELAALNVCLHYDCTIFVTVDNLRRRKFILEHFPSIPETNIGDSLDTSFEQRIKNETRGRGVDLVLSSPNETMLKDSIRCLAVNGRFLELGNRDFSNSTYVQPSYKRSCILTVDITSFFADKKTENSINLLMKDAIEAGMVKPLPRVIFAANELETAYQNLADGKNMGKVLIKLRDDEPNFDCPPAILNMEATPRYYCNAEKSYVICGGLGGFGLELANWLVSRGARKLILNSRRVPHNGYQVSRIRLWRSYGVTVVISTDDISIEEGVRHLLQGAKVLGPVAGIFNVAAALSDNLFGEQTEESFKISAGPKSEATFHLDRVSRQLCHRLEYFVVFSSASTICGFVGVTNYAMSNSAVERICEKRKADNLPALAIQWGMIGDVGILPEKLHFGRDVTALGWEQQSIGSCLRSLETLMRQPNAVMCCGVVGKKNAEKTQNESIPQTVARVLGLKNIGAINLYATLSDLGMDSLTNVEIKNVLNGFEFNLSNEEIRELTFTKLYEMESEFNQRSQKNNKTNGNQEEEIDDMAFTYIQELIDRAENRKTLVVRMPSLLHNGDTTEVSAQEYPTLFYLPGLDGYEQYSRQFSSELSVQVICLEYDFHNVPDTIEEQCEPFVKEIEKRLQPNQEFWLAGYSYGVVTALETTKQLERAGRLGRVWLIDSSLEFMEATEVGGEKSAFDVAKKENLVIDETPLLREIWPKTYKLIKEAFSNSNSQEELAAYLLNNISLETMKKLEPLKEYGIAIYKRMKAYASYKRFSKKTIKSQVTLLRASKSPRKLGRTLSQYLQNPLIVHVVEGDHFTIMKNKSASTAVNEDIKKLLSDGNSEL